MRAKFHEKKYNLFVCCVNLGVFRISFSSKRFSQTQNIKIVSYTYYIDNLGYLDVVGEVQNVGSNTVTSVILTGTVYSSDGTDQADSYTNKLG